jgi:hypothetical protein
VKSVIDNRVSHIGPLAGMLMRGIRVKRID